MPSVVDEDGIEVSVGGEMALTDENIDRFVDLLIVKLRDRGRVSVRDIGKILNRSKSDVHRRYDAVPEEARDFYVSFQLG